MDSGALRAMAGRRGLCDCTPLQPARIAATAHALKAQRIDLEVVFM